MQIAILGPLEARSDSGAALELSGARLRTLLIRLALDPGRVTTTPSLIDALWADEPPAAAANALQALVSRLRRALPEGAVVSHATGYRLAVEPDAVDACRFERLVAAGRALLPHDPAGAAATLAEALSLWRGPALADVTGADFARAPVAHLNELRLAAVEDRTDARLRLGDPVVLVPELEALVAAYPLRERLAGQLIRALAADGRPAEALAAYDRIRVALAETLGADPSPDLAALHLELLRGQPRADAAVRTDNLPAPLTSFVGREEEIGRVAKLIGESRLTTLTGPGGAGKTRLAIESARTVFEQAPDGVWLIELAPVSDGTELPHSVLSVLGVREQALLARTPSRLSPGEAVDPVNRVIAALTQRRALLILDNCEHLIDDAAALVGRLLAACPHLRVLTTSREPLGITGEALCPVEPLALPPPDADAEEAVGYPAVRLLADRARAVRPDFAVDGRTVAAVVRICRALDGMPLAIELAAARQRAMTPEQVATRLDDRFRLLTAGSRTALPRHQTLRAVVDWSWDLLDDAERALCRRLAVFAGDAGVEAIEQVCPGGPVPQERVFDLLTALVDKSLVVTGDNERYRMLETIRAYGLARLAEAGEEEAVRRAHASEFLALAETADGHLRDREQLRWLDRLTTEHDNLHAALRWAITNGHATTAVRYAAALGWYWWLRGHRVEGAELAGQAFSLPGAQDVPRPQLATACAVAATNALGGLADLEQGQAWLTRAAQLAEGHGDAHPMLRLIGPMAAIFDRYFEDPSLTPLAALFHDPEPWVASVARTMHAHAELNLGRPAASAEADLLVALEGFQGLGERWGISFTLTALADLAARRGDHKRAVALYETALVQVRPLGAAEDVPQMQIRLAHELWLLGERDRALTVLDDARGDAERLGAAECVAAVAYEFGEILRAERQWSRARDRLERTAGLVSRLTVAPQWRAMIASSLGYVDAAEGHLRAARARHDEALRLALESHDAPVIAQVLVGLADLALRADRPAGAATLLGAATGVRGGPDLSLLDAPRVEAATRECLGEAMFAEAFGSGQITTMATVRELVTVTLDA